MSRSPAAAALAERLAGLEALDEPAKQVGKKVRELLPGGPVKDLLSGVWLGHPLHPFLTDVPIGTWTSAVLLDLLGGRDAERSATLLTAVGLAAAAPTAVSGYSEWADTEMSSAAVRRIGLLHAASNVTATLLFAGSLAGPRGRRRGLRLAGFGILSAGGWLGGHLSYAEGVGVDQTIFERGRPGDWRPVAAPVPEGAAVHAEVDGIDVCLVRQGGRVHALADRCCHRGGPLHRGELGQGTITCPWHASVFALEDGSVVQGPAAYPQPAFEVRETGGAIEIRAAG